jgi:serine/threonine protein kinase
MKEKYDLLQIIGYDGFGKIYKAKLKNTDELKAVKIIDKKKMIQDSGGEDYFKDEFSKNLENMEICCKDNVNSVKLYEYCNTESELIYVTELVDEDLNKILQKRDKGLNPKEVLGILKQLNNTFKIMVNNLIVHRDLKLSNIFIKYKNNEKSEYIAKLGNYDVSTRLNSLDEKLECMVGTMDYMAPEISKGEKYDGKCDLWSLGVLIYVLLFKKFPKKVTDAASQQLIQSSGNELLDDLLKKLLVEDPARRITWAQYFEHPFFK